MADNPMRNLDSRILVGILRTERIEQLAGLYCCQGIRIAPQFAIGLEPLRQRHELLLEGGSGGETDGRQI